MKKPSLICILFLSICSSSIVLGQPMIADAKFGLSILSGGGSSNGFLFGGALDIPFQENMYIRPEFNLTTHGGTPIELAAILKYNLPSSTSSMPLYIDGGLGLWFYSGGSSLGADFGGGTVFSLSESKLQIPAEIRLGPIFESGTTVFQIALTSGIRFSI